MEDRIARWSHRLQSWVDEVVDATGTNAVRLLAGVALLGAVVGAGWWLTREAPLPVETAIPLVDVTGVTTTTEAPEPVVVHVAGAVQRPGVRRLPPGARVIDAVEASGGLRGDADPGRINLAAPVADGTQIYVPAVGEAVPEPVDASGDAGGIVDLNTADAALLDTLPGVGPATAAAILEHRERHGPFGQVEDLLRVSGIGEAKLAALRDLVTV